MEIMIPSVSVCTVNSLFGVYMSRKPKAIGIGTVLLSIFVYHSESYRHCNIQHAYHMVS